MPLPSGHEAELRKYRERLALNATRNTSLFSTPGEWPETWESFIGQERAVEYLQTAIGSARARGVRLPHVLLASGVPGIGKSSLAMLIASYMGKGFQQVTGPIKMEQAREKLRTMRDGDIFFIEEAHTLGTADGLLTFLENGILTSASGTERMPDVTVVAATTEAQTLPQALLERFPIKPTLRGYSEREATLIVHHLAQRMNLKPLDDELATAVARAAVNNPRKARTILGTLRDTWYANECYDFDRTLRLMNLTPDGLTAEAQDYMIALLDTFNGCASEKNIAAYLNEPATGQTEALLIQLGYIVIKPQGRTLTEPNEISLGGKERAIRLKEHSRD